MRRRRRGAGRRMRGMRRLTYAGKCSQPKAFSLRRRWAALAARMRCSRRSGVIYIVLITAISWPTALTIRHSRFATLTLAKLVASLALHPPVSATEADYAPHQSAFADSFSSRRSLLVSALTNYRSPPRLIPSPNHATWHADFNRRGLAKPDPGGKQEANGGKLAFIRAVQAFTCHGGRVARATPSFINLTFTSQRSLL